MFGLSVEHLVLIAIVILLVQRGALKRLIDGAKKGKKNFKDSYDGVKEVDYRNLDNESSNDDSSKDI